MAKITEWELQFDKLVSDGHHKACDELENTPSAHLDHGNPNHPIHDGLFGYDRDEFMAQQHKSAA